MIDTLFLANKIQEALCRNTYGIDFLIFNDTGDLVKSSRIGTKKIDYVQGVLAKTSAETIPIKNISFRVINTQLSIFVDCLAMGDFETDNERKQNKMLDLIQNILNENLYVLSGQTILIEDGEKNYNVTISMDEATTGIKTSLGDIADLLPLYINISFAIFENGINNNDVKVLLNNEEVYFTRMVVSKNKTSDQSVFANDKKAKVYMLMGGKSIDLTMPVLNTKFSKVLWDEILGDNDINNPISVVIQSPLGDYSFIGVFGNTSTTGDVGQNLGYNFSIVQGVERLLNYGKEWEITTVSTRLYSKTFEDDEKRTIHWGDGSYTICEKAGQYLHEYEEYGQYSIRIYKG